MSSETTLKDQLKEIWEETLAIKPIKADDNFFALGGKSLHALRICDQIERITGKNLPLSILLQAPTIEQLVHILYESEAEKAPHSSSLLPIKANGSKPPLFCIPPAASTALGFADLARYLDPQRPLYGMQPLGLNDTWLLHDRVVDLAIYYVSKMQTIQPEGPYWLFGRCFGGLVAFEMALVLQSRGQQVAFLATLDSGVPLTGLEGEHFSKSAKYSAYYLSRLSDFLSEKQLTRVVLQKAGGKVKQMRDHFGSHHQVSRIHKVAAAHRKANLNYVARVRYRGKIHLFWSDTWNDHKRDTWNLDWSRLTTNGIEIHSIPGAHQTMLGEPSVRIFAKKLDACLEKVLSGEV